MRFIAELSLVANARPQDLSADRLRSIALTIESAGFGGLAFNDHPAPSRKWLEGGGHQAFDPFGALCFSAAVTSRIRVMPLLAVAAYRNPFLLAKAAATVDVLSEGRLTLCLGAGYLRSEFAALGVSFEDRNLLLDETIALLKQVWDGGSFAFVGRGFDGRDQVSAPPARQRPHPPIWIGGNSQVSRERVAQSGNGWVPMWSTSTLAKSARTPPLETVAGLRRAIDDLHRRVESTHRDPATIDVALASGETMPDDLHADRHIDHLQELTRIGVSWFVVRVPVGDDHVAIESIQRYGTTVIGELG